MKSPDKNAEIYSAKIDDQDKASEAFSNIFVELDVIMLEPERPISYHMYRYPFGDMTFIRSITSGGRHQVHRTETLIKKSVKNNFYIGFLLSGEATLIQDEHKATLTQNDIALLDSTREYIIDVPQGFDSVWITVPRYRLEGRMLLPEHILAQRIDGNTGTGHVVSSMLRAALEEASNIDVSRANRIANHLLDLIALSLQTVVFAQNETGPSRHQKSVLRRIQHYIESHLDEEELTPNSIAQQNGISIRYLSKLFEREGTSTAKWIRMRRLERCRYDLENTEKRHLSVNEIAYAHGFANISSFNRAFRRQFQITPSAIRSRQSESTD